MLAPEVEALPWAEQLALDDRPTASSSRTSSSARPSIAPSSRTRASGRPAPRAAWPASRRCRSPTRASCASAARPRIPIGEHLCATRDEIVRVYSTSGTTGTPSFVPLTAGDLDNWITASARSYAASGIASGERIVSTYNAGPFVAGAALASFDRIGLCHVPVGTGNSERLMLSIDLLRPEAAVLTPSYAAYLIEWAAERDVDLAGSSVAARARRRRARRRRAGLPREARGGLGRAGDRGDGHRRHRRLAVGRVRAAGRDAPGRARLHPPRADRSRDGRRGRAGGRRDRRARAHAPAPSRCAAAALPHARPRAGAHEPLRVRPHRPARALHRPHRRHADRARRQRLPVRRARGRERASRRGSAATSSCGRSRRASSRSRRSP